MIPDAVVVFVAQALLFARQPIFDRHSHVWGYEMLYRSADGTSRATRSPEAWTASVSVQAVLEIGLDTLVGPALALFNVTRPFFLQHLYEFLPPERAVLEILEDTHVDDELIREIERAKRLGFKLALDDFILSGPTQALVPFADIIKVEVSRLDEEGVRLHARRLARPELLLLAEKVETHAVRRWCESAGYHLFQGYFFARPELVSGRQTPPNRMVLLRLLATIQDPEAPIGEIERLIAASGPLAHKLLVYLNSAFVALAEPIRSIRQAVMMLGLERVRICAAMLILASIDTKPHELVVAALLRARCCQLLGASRGDLDEHELFTVGLLSLLDAFLDLPLQEILDGLPLAQDVKAALVGGQGGLAEVLGIAVALERMDEERLSASPIDREASNGAYIEALRWTREFQDSLGVARAQP
jgi:EAL and modified HD-GYP domain-containing signal transduction protein